MSSNDKGIWLEMTDPDFARITLALVILLVGGTALNWWVDQADRRDKNHFSWAFVVIGVGSTLVIALLVVPWQWVLWVMGCFAASGTPMIVGALMRHERRMDADKKKAADELVKLKNQLLELSRADQTAPAGK